MYRFPGLQIYGKRIKKKELCSVKNKIFTRRNGDEMEDYSIANTTKEQRIALIRQWIPDEDGLGDSGDMDLWDIYADYINGKREIAEIKLPDLNAYTVEEAMKIVEDFVKELTGKLKQSEIEYKLNIVGEYIEVELNGENAGYLIGYRGETLNSIQVIMNSVLKNRMKTHLKVTVDICGYKKERVKTLEQLAERVANTVIKTGKTVTLDPMRPYERKIIHSKLQENSKIRTHSVGEEPYRKIVISLNK